MSSPIQPPPNIRSPSTQQQTAQSTLPPVPSPYAHHLPPPNLPPAGQPSVQNTNVPLPPPSRIAELPSILTSPRNNSSSPSYSHHSLPPANSLTSTSTNDQNNATAPVLPPIPTRTSTPPYNERRQSVVRQPSSIQQSASTPPPVQQQQSPQQTGGSYRPLNVRDALTYLDQVKIRFSDQPEVYNRFLDIMKDFKSQAIDTPGVIERVSTLFRGHPNLISGFNTFLPPGYRIECSTDPREPDLITVTTPNGVTTTGPHRMMESSTAGYPPPVIPPPSQQQNYYPYGHMHHHPPPQQSAPMHSIPPVMNQPPLYQQHRPQPPPPPPPPQPTAHSPSNKLSISTNNVHSSPTQQHTLTSEKRSPIEFNHAINYVNKIKNRYANDPEVYKQFLEVLQTYQKDSKPIQEVYSTVQYLFNGAPDLLDEFKQFLPDITGQPSSVLFESISSSSYYGSKRSAMDSAPSSALLPPGKKKRANNPITKKNKLFQKDGLGDMIAHRDPYNFTTTPFDPARPSVSAEEIELFERIRKHIGNKPSYEEFLKTLNLYTQQIFDLDTLVEQVHIFIGSNKELYDWFKSVVGYEPKQYPIEKPTRHIPKPDLAHCKATHESPSYRIVPRNWSTQPCSGRDELAWEVLNDEYVSHPIWASEDDGFVASKKSQYEEAMHRCEEERYDYNVNIEANLSVIALLEPINQRIENMTLEERADFRLNPGLGGESVSIYERIIKKVYDKDRGLEIIELLYSNPATVVPILLKRLKQKDEEWKKAQREWNKIWREHDAKNFYRALDYQGITFKSNDRKAMAPKVLVTEIESLQNEKKLKEGCSKAVHTKEPFQFQFPFKDPEIFKDVTRVIYSFIDRQAGYTNSEREKVRTFIQTFIPLCFQVENVVPEGFNYTDENEDEELAEEDDDNHSTNTEDSESDIGRSPSTNNKRSQSPSRRRLGKNGRYEEERTMDLLRDVLTKNQNALDENSLPPLDRSPSPFVTPDDVVKKESPPPTLISTLTGDINEPPQLEENGKKLFEAAAAAIAPGYKKRSLYSFFCNTTFYCFFRQYEMLYSRLAKLRTLDEEMKSNPNMGKRINKVAHDLGLYSSRFDDVELANGFYNAILEMIDRFFDGEMDQQVFEEQSRYIFVTDAYLIFTIDKLVHSMIKQIQAIIVDPKSVDLIRLFRSDKSIESKSPKALSIYRLKTEDIIGSDENLYRINFDNDSKMMTIQLIGKDDYVTEPTAEDRYEDYVASYMDWINTTEGIDTSSMKPTFLNRNLRPHDEHLSKIVVRSKLQYKIDQSSYHMYYIVGSEDIFIRPHQEKEQRNSSTNNRWLDWIESSTTGWSKGLDEQTKRSMEDEAKNLLSNSTI